MSFLSRYGNPLFRSYFSFFFSLSVALMHALLFYGHPLARNHLSTFTCLLPAACAQALSSHGHSWLAATSAHLGALSSPLSGFPGTLRPAATFPALGFPAANLGGGRGPLVGGGGERVEWLDRAPLWLRGRALPREVRGKKNYIELVTQGSRPTRPTSPTRPTRLTRLTRPTRPTGTLRPAAT